MLHLTVLSYLSYVLSLYFAEQFHGKLTCGKHFISLAKKNLEFPWGADMRYYFCSIEILGLLWNHALKFEIIVSMELNIWLLEKFLFIRSFGGVQIFFCNLRWWDLININKLAWFSKFGNFITEALRGRFILFLCFCFRNLFFWNRYRTNTLF